MSSEDILNTCDTFMKSLDNELSDGDKRLPYLYWTLKLHKPTLKHCFIAGSSTCTTEQLSSFIGIFHQHQPVVSMHLSSFAMPIVA